jgi:hypothetical protein
MRKVSRTPPYFPHSNYLFFCHDIRRLVDSNPRSNGLVQAQIPRSPWEIGGRCSFTCDCSAAIRDPTATWCSQPTEDPPQPPEISQPPEIHPQPPESPRFEQGPPPDALERTHPIPQSNSLNESVIVKEFPPENDRVYRVQGIPIRFTIEEVGSLLRSVLDPEESSSVEIRSLAIYHNQTAQVATVSFAVTPLPLSPSRLGPDMDYWSFKYRYGEGTEHRNCKISFDIHFRGLTILKSFPNSKDYKIECASFPSSRLWH